MIKRHSILTAILLCFVAFTQVMAQEMQEPEPLPIDPKVRYGKLSNGLTYYIRHNDQPKDRADFYIAQNVGSMLEDYIEHQFVYQASSSVRSRRLMRSARSAPRS